MRLLNAAASKSFPLGKWRYRVALATLALRVTASTVTALGPPERNNAAAASSKRARDRAGRGSVFAPVIVSHLPVWKQDYRSGVGLVAGVVIAVGFGVVEFRRGRQPLLEVRLFADPNFATGVAAIVVLFGATFGFFYMGMQYVQQIIGYSPLTTAIAFGPFMVPLGIFSALSFRYVPKLGLRLVLFVGTLFMAIGCLRGERHIPRNGWSIGNRGRRFDPGRSLLDQPAPKPADIPAPVRGPATDSLAKAVEVAGKLGPQGRQLADLSKRAFLTAPHASTHHDGRDRRHRRSPHRTVGSRARRATAQAGAPDRLGPEVLARRHRVVARRKRPTKTGVFGAGVVRTEPPGESSPENTSADPGWAIPSA